MNSRTLSKPTRRRGFSFLELQVAFLLLGIALAGLGPLVVMQSKQLRALEERFNDQDTYYLVPSPDAWARKLGAAATIQTEDPGTSVVPVTFIDNDDPGYSERDAGPVYWTSHSESDAFAGELRRHDGSGVGDAAIWEFSGIAAGWYQVLVTYDADDNYATDAPYTVFDGATAEATVRIDQTEDPSGGLFQGYRWESLGLFSVGGDVLRVELSDDADNTIAADAVRIVAVRNQVEILSSQKSLESDTATAHVSVTLMVP